MQTFSYMQRNIDDKKNIIYFFIFLFSLFYEVLTTIYTILPPFWGVGFWFFMIFYIKREFIFIFFIFIYLLFFEIDHSLPLFSLIIFYFLLLPLFLKLLKILSNKYILKILSVVLIYLLYPLFIYALHKFFKTDIFSLDLNYFLYMITEIIILIFLG